MSIQTIDSRAREMSDGESASSSSLTDRVSRLERKVDRALARGDTARVVHLRSKLLRRRLQLAEEIKKLAKTRRKSAATAATTTATTTATATTTTAVAFEHNWSEHVSGTTKFTRGKWSKAEDEKLRAAIDEFCLERGIDAASCAEIAQAPVRGSPAAGVWTAVAATFTTRTIRSVMRRGIRLLHPGNHRGAWTDGERESLRKLVARHGRAWKAIGAELNRIPSSCQIVFSRMAIQISGGGGGGGGAGDTADDAVTLTTAAGHNGWEWSSEEESLLLGAVRKQCVVMIGGVESVNTDLLGSFSGPWAPVSRAVGTRTVSQCIDKWSVKGASLQGIKWTRLRDVQLVSAVVECGLAATRATVPWSTLVTGIPAGAARLRYDMLMKESHVVLVDSDDVVWAHGAKTLLAAIKLL